MSPRVSKRLTCAALWVATVFFTGVTLIAPASATTWKIDEVLTGAGVTGFGASGFHDASGSNVMSGSNLGDATGMGMLGTYNDVTGAFSGTFDLSMSGGPTFDLSGTGLIFGVAGKLVSNSTLEVNFAAGSLNGASSGTILGFKPGFVCCNTTNAPNSFISDGGAGAIMTLWGADGFNKMAGTYSGSLVGLDLRVHLSVVSVPSTIPLPAALPLFGVALSLMGFVGWRRKSKGTET